MNKYTVIAFSFFICLWCCRSLVGISPQELLTKKAQELYQNGSYEQALIYYKLAGFEYSDNLSDLMILGNLSMLCDKQEEGKKIFKRMLEINPTCYPALGNLGCLFMGEGNFEKAKEIYEYLLTKAPYDRLVIFNLSRTYLTLGELGKGFKLQKILYDTEKKNVLDRKWDGNQSLAGKHFLITLEEHCFGDLFQFIRYAKEIKEKGAYVSMEVHRPLVTLISLCPYIDQVIAQGESYPDYDFYLPLREFPMVLQTKLDSIPSKIPYLYADESLVANWREKLIANNNIKVGLCWQGRTKETVASDSNMERHICNKRAFSLSLYSSLALIEGISFYILQKLDTLDEMQSESNGNFIVHDFGPDFDKSHGSFMDTAAIMKNLDLVITVDTSIAHLAGALGVRTWVIIPFMPNWRWMLTRNDSPWYPTMMLFRQQERNGWDHVVISLEKALQKFVQERKSK